MIEGPDLTAMQPQGNLERGRRAYAIGAWGDAHALLAAADREATLRGEDLDRLATSAFLIGREEEFERTLERAHRAYQDAGDRPRAARCAFWIGFGLFLRGETGPASGWLARGRRLLEDEERETVEAGYLLLPVIEGHMGAGDWEQALEMARDVAGIGTRLGDPDLAAAARHVEGRALLGMGAVEEGLALLDEAMVAVTSGELSPIMTGLVYCSVIGSCQRVHALGRAREWTAALRRWCEDQRQLVAFTSTCLVHRAEILQLHGSWAEALAEARRARERHADGLDARPPAAAFTQEAEVLRLWGELDAAEEAYGDAIRAGAEPQPGLALLWLARGRVDASAAAIGRALDATNDPFERARLLPAQVEILLAARDLRGARRACEELESLAARFDIGVFQATAAQARGALAQAEGRPRDALVDLHLAWRQWQALEVPYEAARVRELIGLACRALGDDDGGRLELEAARATYADLGAAPDCARVEALLRPRIVAPTYGLTRRELEVLRLVAAGGSNKGIADELSLSVKTIERHVSNILAKLDVPSRAAATAWAYEHEIVHPSE